MQAPVQEINVPMGSTDEQNANMITVENMTELTSSALSSITKNNPYSNVTHSGVHDNSLFYGSSTGSFGNEAVGQPMSMIPPTDALTMEISPTEPTTAAPPVITTASVTNSVTAKTEIVEHVGSAGTENGLNEEGIPGPDSGTTSGESAVTVGPPQLSVSSKTLPMEVVVSELVAPDYSDRIVVGTPNQPVPSKQPKQVTNSQGVKKPATTTASLTVAAVGTTPPAKRARPGNRKEVIAESFRESLLQALVTEFYSPTTESEKEGSGDVTADRLAPSIHSVMSSLRKRATLDNNTTTNNAAKNATAAIQLEKQIDAAFSPKLSAKNRVELFLKLVDTLSPKTGPNDRIRQARVRVAKLMYGLAKSKDPLFNELASTSQLNLFEQWITEFLATKQWRSISLLLYVLATIPMSTESLKTNKDVARKVKELVKISKQETTKKWTLEEKEEIARIEARSKKLFQKWVGSIRGKAEKTDRTEKTKAATKEKDKDSTATVSSSRKRTLDQSTPPSSTAPNFTGTTTTTAASAPPSTAAVKKVKALSDDDLFGNSPPPVKKKLAVPDFLKGTAKDDLPVPKKATEDGGKGVVGKNGDGGAGGNGKGENGVAGTVTGSGGAVEAANGSSSRSLSSSAAGGGTSTAAALVAPVKQKKRVTWAPGDQLNSVEYIETRTELARLFYQEPVPDEYIDKGSGEDWDESEDRKMQDRLHDMDAERIRVQKIAIHKRLDSMEPDTYWQSPSLVLIPEEVKAGVKYDGVEMAMRATMVSVSPEVFPDPKRDATPTEAPFTNYTSDNPPLIPLESDTNDRDDDEEATEATEATEAMEATEATEATGAAEAPSAMDVDPSASSSLPITREQWDLAAKMTTEILWRRPPNLLVQLDCVTPAYYGSEFSARSSHTTTTRELFPKGVTSPEEAPAEPPANDANTLVVPAHDKDPTAVEESPPPDVGGTNQAVALASLLRNAMDPSAVAATTPTPPVSTAPAQIVPSITAPTEAAVLQNFLEQLVAHQQQLQATVGAPHQAPPPPSLPTMVRPPNSPPSTTAKPYNFDDPKPRKHNGNKGHKRNNHHTGGTSYNTLSSSNSANSTGGAGPTAGICKFYNKSRGCKNGDSCRFIHSDA